ncbi:MAG: tetratricopeptide repeat protein [Acidobacteriota bacterium]
MTIGFRISSTLLVSALFVALLAQGAPKTPEQCVAGVDLEISLENLAAERAGRAPNDTKALQVASGCIEKHPAFAPAWVKRGNVRTFGEDWDGAIADYAKALQVDPKNDSAYRDRAFAHLKKDNYAAAIADYDKALEIDAKDILAVIGRGDVHRVKGDAPRALADYNSALVLAKDDFLGEVYVSGAYFGRALLFVGQDRWDEAVPDLTRVIEDGYGPTLSAYELRAMIYGFQKKTALAVADYDAILEMQPGHAEALERRGALHLGNGDRAKATADFQALLAIDPKNEKAIEALSTLKPRSAGDYMKVAQTKANAQQWDEAIRAYDDALRIEPGNAGAYAGRASAHANKGAKERAYADYAKAIQLDPKAAGAYGGRAYLYESQGDHARAIADYSRSIEVADATDKVTRILAYTNRGDIYSRQNQTAVAIADYDQAIAVAATDSMFNYVLGPDAYLGRGKLHAAAGKKDLARADFRKALELNPKHDAVQAELTKLDPPAAPAAAPAAPQQAATPKTHEEWFRLALSQGRGNDAAGALASLTKCLELKPDALPCLVLRGNVLAMKGDYAAAAADYRKATETDPNHPAAYAGRGIMLAKQGKRDEAIRELRTALRLKPDFADAQRALKMLGETP